MSSPVRGLVLVTISITFQTLLVAGPASPSVEAPTIDDDFGGLDILGDILEIIFDAVVWFTAGLTFSLIDGTPWWISVVVTTAIFGAIFWPVIQLIRGTGA